MTKAKTKVDFDQFYTQDVVARDLIRIALQHVYTTLGIRDYWYLEPAAGTGSFLHALPGPRIGVDIDPKADDIVLCDFIADSDKLQLGPRDTGIAVGNPPFGRGGNLALRFINACADVTSAVCFILPRTFKKASYINRVDRRLTLVHTEDLAENIFLLNNNEYSVPCCFQIWIDTGQQRALLERKITSEYVEYVRVPDKAVIPDEVDIIVWRVGGRSGRIIDRADVRNNMAHHFFKVKKPHSINSVIERIQKSKFIKANDTAGMKSISLPEFYEALDAAIDA